MKTRTAHTHLYAVHPNPAWAATHHACQHCGFACPNALVPSHLKATK